MKQFESMNDAYKKLYLEVERNGFLVSPRRKLCKEIRPYSFVIDNPLEGLYTGIQRKLNYRFGIIESMLYIAGENNSRSVNLLCNVNPNMSNFLDQDKNSFNGAYGPRLEKGLSEIYDLLKYDPWSRQAVASIWNNVEERYTLDLPCTLNLQFFCTKNASGCITLNLKVNMRSNDLNWGIPYDVAAFCEILVSMTGCLGYDLGKYYHDTGSLHFYIDSKPNIKITDNFDDTENMIKKDYMFPSTSVIPRMQSWEKFKLRNKQIVNQAYTFVETGHKWYSDINEFDEIFRHLVIDEWSERIIKLMRWSWTEYNIPEEKRTRGINNII